MDLMDDTKCKKTNCDTTKDNKVEQGEKGPPPPGERTTTTKCLVPAVPPVLKNVGKLAAGVAGMASGSATEKKVDIPKPQPKCVMKECITAKKSKCPADSLRKVSACIELGTNNISGHKNKELLYLTQNPEDTEEEKGSCSCRYKVEKCKNQKVKFQECKKCNDNNCEEKRSAMDSNSQIECKISMRNDCSQGNNSYFEGFTKFKTNCSNKQSNYSYVEFHKKRYSDLISDEDVVYSCDNKSSTKKPDQFGITANISSDNFDSFGAPKTQITDSNKLNQIEAGTSGINNNTRNVLVSNNISTKLIDTPWSQSQSQKSQIDKLTETMNKLPSSSVDLFGVPVLLTGENSIYLAKNIYDLSATTVFDKTDIATKDSSMKVTFSANTSENSSVKSTKTVDLFSTPKNAIPSNSKNNLNLLKKELLTKTSKTNFDLFANNNKSGLDKTKQKPIDLFSDPNTSIYKNPELLIESTTINSSQSAPLFSNNGQNLDSDRKKNKKIFSNFLDNDEDDENDEDDDNLSDFSYLPNLSDLSDMAKDINRNPYFIRRRFIGVNNCKCKKLGKNRVTDANVESCKIFTTTLGMNACSHVGNPRNKTALQPGHSLMDWIRLSHSGQDLTGVGPKAGTLSVSPKQLAEHNTENDAWIAIRGKVYNVTAYFDFHPGGKEELMKGVGQDATQMFNAVHPWVNYESILQKCLVGRLTSVDVDEDTYSLFYGRSNQTIKVPRNFRFVPTPSVLNVNGGLSNEEVISPKFDWVQQLDYVTTIFYTKPLSNPQVQVTAPTKENELDIILTYNKYIFKNHLHFSNNIHWPCKVTINWDTGKVDVNFRKIVSKIWDNYGTLTQESEKVTVEYEYEKIKYIVLNNVKENYNTHLIAFQRIDGVKQTIPIGSHLKVYGTIDDQELIRFYTPVPCSFMRKYSQDYEAYRGDVCLLIKSYPEGLLSPTICNSVKGDVFELSPPLGSLNLEKIASRNGYLILAAGTGITPMLAIIKFILESTQIKCEKLYILYFNRSEEDIILRKHFDSLKESDERVEVKYILSHPGDHWTGLTGHIDGNLLKKAIDDQCSDSQLFPVDIFSLICGPLVFTNLAKSLLLDIGYTDDQIHLFGS